MSPAHGQRRRNIIRSTWHKMYDNDRFTLRFVISNPGELWAPFIQHEMETYQDIIVLSHLEENATVANTIKTIEFFTYLTKGKSTWKWVSKIDDDSFLDTESFYRDFLQPRMDENRTMIARPTFNWNRGYLYPQGQFYTFSWDLLRILTDCYSRNRITDEHEDALSARLLYEEGYTAGENYTLVELGNDRFFDYDPEVRVSGQYSHAIMPDSINPHKLKSDEIYLDVARQMAELQRFRNSS
ncbi:hypothetical protein PV08_01924 [Exophiala spinifera]|uniref:Hexosyltransferase n=1 Tax=Exophiala spinifera TaxID=91928 RepID=A0A0D2CCW4_9EURO|nr:uncharacterized protein PV08_01924 [Exophiala spinifera]KIW21344.1 hypothetical protein PV08_01924 [Exophiala spinifera]